MLVEVKTTIRAKRGALRERESDFHDSIPLEVGTPRLNGRAAEVKAARNAEKWGESVPAARESGNVFFAHLVGYKARPVSLQSLGR